MFAVSIANAQTVTVKFYAGSILDRTEVFTGNADIDIPARLENTIPNNYTRINIFFLQVRPFQLDRSFSISTTHDQAILY